MVHGERFVNSQSSCAFGNQSENSDSSKRNGFMALQKKIADKQSATKLSTMTNVNKSRSATKTTNWGPFKNREDFVNMHFS